MADFIDEKWVVLWFPPEADRTRSFSDEGAARRFTASEGVSEWHPILERHTIETTVRQVPL